MTITLRKEYEELIAEAMQTGAYQSPDEVIGRALEMLHSQDEWLREHRQEVTDKIERALRNLRAASSCLRSSRERTWRIASQLGTLTASLDGLAI